MTLLHNVFSFDLPTALMFNLMHHYLNKHTI